MSKRTREEGEEGQEPTDATATTATEGDKSSEAAATASPAKRGRGRPKKTAQPQGEAHGDDDTEKSNGSGSPAGRPRRAAKDKAAAAVSGNGQGSTEGTGDSAAPVKRGRGRPKKDPNAPPTPRKKKTEATPPPLNADGTPVKRGRGRPRKDPNAPPTPRKKKTEATPPPLNADGTPVKRGRGRPRKNPLAPEGDIKKKSGASAKKQKTEGKEEASSTSSSSGSTSGSRYLEKGWIYFFYRPKVEHAEAHSIKDVQKLYMLLVPRVSEETEGHAKQRLIVLAKKKLPEIHSHSRYWGFVEEVGDRFEEIHHDLDKITYKTKTLGTRTIEAARPVGEGFYGIIEHHGHTHLAYVLELPQEIGKAQKAFNICKEGSYIITIKNPNAPVKVDVPGIHLKEHVSLPKELLDRFHGKRWMPANPPTVLDYERVELVIISTSDDLKAELGEAGKELEKDEEKDVQAKHLSDNTLFEELHMSKKTHPPMALLKGQFQ